MLDAGNDKKQAFADQRPYWTGFPSSGFNNARRVMIMDGTWMPGATRRVVDVTGVELDSVGYGFHPSLYEGLKAIVLTPAQSQCERLWQRAIEKTIVGAKSAEDALFEINTELQQSLIEYWETQG